MPTPCRKAFHWKRCAGIGQGNKAKGRQKAKIQSRGSSMEGRVGILTDPKVRTPTEERPASVLLDGQASLRLGLGLAHWYRDPFETPGSRGLGQGLRASAQWSRAVSPLKPECRLGLGPACRARLGPALRVWIAMPTSIGDEPTSRKRSDLYFSKNKSYVSIRRTEDVNWYDSSSMMRTHARFCHRLGAS